MTMVVSCVVAIAKLQLFRPLLVTPTHADSCYKQSCVCVCVNECLTRFLGPSYETV